MNLVAEMPFTSENPDVSIDVRSKHWHDEVFDASEICRTAAAEAIAAVSTRLGGVEISVVLADDAFVRDLNKTWRNIDAPTNVLAFPCSDSDDIAAVGAETLLGDVIVAFQTTKREATEQQIPLEQHFAHLIVHGVLHLLGYDHIDDGDAVVMEKLEIEALARMGIGDPYGEDTSDG